jgi:NAD(P)H-dependent FMN reductase
MATYLALCGSLRAASSSKALLRAAAALAPDGFELQVYPGLAELPAFNPDVEEAGTLPAAAAELRARVGAAAGLVVATPEYAHGLPGSLKNALDWLVGGMEMYGKPVAVLNPSPVSHHADAQLREILRTMSAQVVEGASRSFPIRAKDESAILEDAELSAALRQALAVLAEAIATQ